MTILITLNQPKILQRNKQSFFCQFIFYHKEQTIMNRNFIFALILLVALFSIVNASPLHLRDGKATQFNKCEGYPKSSFPELLTVKLTPDPIAKEQTFEVSITLQNYDITPGTVLNIDIVDQDNPRLLMFYSIDICSQTDCPVKAGTTYSSTQKITLPSKLPSKYFIRVEHFMNAPDVTIPYSCAIAIVGS